MPFRLKLPPDRQPRILEELRLPSGDDLDHTFIQSQKTARRFRDLFYASGLILLVTLVLHGPSLFDGKVLDDFWHQKGLRAHGWSFSELLHTLVIRPSDFLHTWWQDKDFCWHYFRPFFILCMKVVFLTIGRGNPMALHAFSLILHYLSALLVWRLCWRLTQDRFWSLVGGLLFATYPHSVVTVAWPSSQNCVLQTTLLLGGLLCYVKASGLSLDPRESLVSASMSVNRRYFVSTLVLWILAMFSRENAVLMPAIFVAFDLAFGGLRTVRSRFSIYAVFGVIGTAFVALRLANHIPPLPDVYCRLPNGDYFAYGLWLFAKFLHYICASIWIAPLSTGPTGRINPWSEVPGDCLFMLTIVATMSFAYYWFARSARGWWIWPLWIALSILPVLPVVATPHSGYMCGVGFAIAAALAPATARRHLTRKGYRWAAGATIFLMLGMTFMAAVARLQWIGIYSAERYLPAWMMISQPDKQTRDVYFINMPFVNVYCKPNMVDRLGPWFEDVNVHVLTFAPQVLEMNCRTTLQQESANSFTVSIEEQPYFSRLMGRFVLEAWRGKRPFHTGDEIQSEKFQVTILEADDQGVWKLRFTFRTPLTDRSNCFYLCSSNCGAARIRFKPILSAQTRHTQMGPPLTDLAQLSDRLARFELGDVTAAAAAIATMGSPNADLASKAEFGVRKVASTMATALGAPIQPILDKSHLTLEDRQKLLDWWANDLDKKSLIQIWQHRHDFDNLVYLRAEVEWDRWLASFLFKTDLYLTGPPFDGPAGPLPIKPGAKPPEFIPAYRQPWRTSP